MNIWGWGGGVGAIQPFVVRPRHTGEGRMVFVGRKKVECGEKGDGAKSRNTAASGKFDKMKRRAGGHIGAQNAFENAVLHIFNVLGCLAP